MRVSLNHYAYLFVTCYMMLTYHRRRMKGEGGGAPLENGPPNFSNLLHRLIRICFNYAL